MEFQQKTRSIVLDQRSKKNRLRTETLYRNVILIKKKKRAIPLKNETKNLYEKE